MTAGLLGLTTAGQAAFKAPYFDYHALAPEIVLTVVIMVVLVVDLIVDETHKPLVAQIAGVGILASAVPIFTLAAAGISGHARVMFGGAYTVDVFSLVLKALFLGIGYVILLMSTNYIEEGDYYEGEFAFLILCSMLGMLVMASSRDLITIFIALELLSIPGYLLAGWRKRDLQVQRGVAQVLPARGAGQRGDAVRDVAHLRRHRHHPAHRHLRQARRGQQSRPKPPAGRHHRHLLRGGRVRLQGVRRAVPLLGPRYL